MVLRADKAAANIGRPPGEHVCAAILPSAAACELVIGGSWATSAAAHALRPCSRDTRPASWSGQRSSAFFPGGSASLGACGVGGPAGDVPSEGGGMLGES